jgi:hypothetical protein
MRLELAQVAAMPDRKTRNEKIYELMKKCTPYNPPMLSDLLVNYDFGGHHVMVTLGDRFISERDLPYDQWYRWRLKVRYDQWGKPVKPGDKVVLKRQTNLKEDDKMVSSSALNAAKADGSYDRRFSKMMEYIVDNKGCIACTFQDAVTFIHNFGIHPISKLPIKAGPEKLQTDNPEEKKKPIPHYWRYEEVSDEEYQDLPTITPVNNTHAKRGNK